MTAIRPDQRRGLLVAGNWKMNQNCQETEAFFQSLKDMTPHFLEPRDIHLLSDGHLRACVIPPFLSLTKAIEQKAQLKFPLSVSAQNAHWEKKGAFTGEVSGPMLKEIHVSWVLAGHSERRQVFLESDSMIQKRVKSLIEQDFHVIFCIGETQSEREAGKTEAVLSEQIQNVIGSDSELNGRLIIAYEPVWAIGTGLTATTQQVENAHSFIRQLLLKRFGQEASERTSILYGGSVTVEFMDSLLSCKNVDGVLVGGASLKPESFLGLLQKCAKKLRNTF